MEIEEFDNELRVTLADREHAGWLGRRLRKEGSATVSKVFTVTPVNVVEGMGVHDGRIIICIAERHGGYWKIDSNILGIEFDLYLSTYNKWKRKHFVVEKGVKIFPRLNEIVSDSMWVGGNHPDAIPFAKYNTYIRKLPSYTELHKYVAVRLANSVREHFNVKGDPERQYENFLSKRIRGNRNSETIESPIEGLVSIAEVEKFTLLIGRL